MWRAAAPRVKSSRRRPTKLHPHHRILPMCRPRLLACLALLLAVAPAAVRADDVPEGELKTYVFDKSKTFPGTTREYTVYVPKQYDPKTLACVYVNQGGVQF